MDVPGPGVLAVLFAAMAFLWSGLTLAALVLVWGAFAVVDGVLAFLAGAKMRWWSILSFGVVGVVTGLVAVLWPSITAVASLVVVSVWAGMRGVLEIAGAIGLRRELTNEWLLILSGIASVIFGALMLSFSTAGALALTWFVGLQALVVGVLSSALAFRLRRFHRHRVRIDLGTDESPRRGVGA